MKDQIKQANYWIKHSAEILQKEKLSESESSGDFKHTLKRLQQAKTQIEKSINIATKMKNYPYQH